MNNSNDSQQKFTAIAAVVFIALIGIIAYLIWNKSQLEEQITLKQDALMETERLKVDLDKQYYEALSELESMRTGNEELNALIDTQKEELAQQRNKIRGLINSGKSSKAELKQARDQIALLKGQLDGYVTSVNQLKEENELLALQNTTLSNQNQELSQNLTSANTMNEELVQSKNALTSEKESLLSEKSELTKVVTRASVIEVIDVSASAWKVRKSGKPAKTKSAAKTDRIKVCFTTTENAVASSGNEEFFVRVINPIGETMAMENLGSGIMKSAENEDMRYTQVKELPYENNAVVGCFLWEPGIAFKSGKHSIEVFNKGFLAGKGTFALK